MSALTPDCDPDLSTCGSPVRCGPDEVPGGGPGIRSTLVLLAVLAVSVVAATGEAVPGAVAFLAGGVALVSALVLGRRGVRLARRTLPAAGSLRWAAAGRRSRPAG